jgi:hypothetical protein
MDIEAAEDAILAAIRDTGAKAEAFPENPELYVPKTLELMHIVRYDDSTFAEPVPNRKRVIQQETRHQFLVVTIFRHLRGHSGAYAHLEALREALTGLTIPNVAQATVLYPVRRNFLMEKGGLWYWQTTFAMSCPESEAA